MEGRVVFVEGAESFEFASCAFEGDVFADDFDDVDGVADSAKDFGVVGHGDYYVKSSRRLVIMRP